MPADQQTIPLEDLRLLQDLLRARLPVQLDELPEELDEVPGRDLLLRDLGADEFCGPRPESRVPSS